MAGYEEDSLEQESMRKMFVGGLNRSTTDEAFFDYFGQYGTMVDKVVIKDPNTKESRGFGFITYDHSDAVEGVFRSRPHELDGKTLDVKRAMPRDFDAVNHAKVKKLFVGGVFPTLTEDMLRSYLDSRHSNAFGSIERIDLIKDEQGNNKKFAFIEVSDFDFADRLTISEQQFQIDGNTMRIKKSEQKGQDGGQGGAGGFQRRGGSRGGSRGSGGRGGGRGGRGGSNRGGYGGNRSNYNQGYNDYSQNGYSQQGGYNSYPQTGYPQQYQNQGGYQSNQYQGSYQGYGSGYNQNQGYGGNQGYSSNQGNNRYTPY